MKTVIYVPLESNLLSLSDWNINSELVKITNMANSKKMLKGGSLKNYENKVCEEQKKRKK